MIILEKDSLLTIRPWCIEIDTKKAETTRSGMVVNRLWRKGELGQPDEDKITVRWSGEEQTVDYEWNGRSWELIPTPEAKANVEFDAEATVNLNQPLSYTKAAWTLLDDQTLDPTLKRNPIKSERLPEQYYVGVKVDDVEVSLDSGDITWSGPINVGTFTDKSCPEEIRVEGVFAKNDATHAYGTPKSYWK